MIRWKIRLAGRWLYWRFAPFVGWLHLPHPHNGYTARAGNTWPCDFCGKLPADGLASCVTCGTIRPGGSWVSCPDCGSGSPG